MSQRLVLALVVALAAGGCAVQPSAGQRLSAAPNVNLCEAAYYAPPEVGMQAREEAARRGINCADYMAAVVQLQQQRALAPQMAAPVVPVHPIVLPAMTYTPVLPPPPPRQSFNCRTYRVGADMHTDCN